MKPTIKTCADAREVDLVDYLALLGHQPQKIRNADHWYLSPLREENTPSFKVNRQLNVWYDHGTGQGGDIIDFGTQYYRCTVNHFLERLADFPAASLSFHSQPSPVLPAPGSAGERKGSGEGKIVIQDLRPLADQSLLNYLDKRNIPVDTASQFCREVDFLLYGKQHTVIGFPNNSGGYELRNENFKGSSSPKDVTLQQGRRSDDLVVFEGFFNFLSFQAINKEKQAPLSNCLILNSLSFFEKSRPLMEEYKTVHLILDRDNAGTNATKKALEWNTGKGDKYTDRSEFYKGHKDLNAWLIYQQYVKEQSRSIGRHL